VDLVGVAARRFGLTPEIASTSDYVATQTGDTIVQVIARWSEQLSRR
jgi:hypothetical protein